MKLRPPLRDKIAAAKLWLISESSRRELDAPRDLPYLAAALYALVPVPNTDVARISCDEHWRVYLNPDWLTTATVPELGAELAHVTWHLLYEHADRARDLHVDASTAGSWTAAADAAVAQLLRTDGLAPPELPAAESLGLPEGRSAEEYYAILSGLPAMAAGPSEPDEVGCGSGCDGLVRSSELPPGLDLGEVDSNDARQIRRVVAIAYREHVTGRGTEPGDAWRWSKHILEPTIAWEPLLAAAVRRAVAWASGNAEYTYSRRSRRQSAVPRVLLPGTRRPLPDVALVVDTSGSVDDTLLGRALGEVDGALAGLGVAGTSVTVLACDAAVHTVKRVRRARDTRLAGGGGTGHARRAGGRYRAAAPSRPRRRVHRRAHALASDAATGLRRHRRDPGAARARTTANARLGAAHRMPAVALRARRLEPPRSVDAEHFYVRRNVGPNRVGGLPRVGLGVEGDDGKALAAGPAFGCASSGTSPAQMTERPTDVSRIVD